MADRAELLLAIREKAGKSSFLRAALVPVCTTRLALWLSLRELCALQSGILLANGRRGDTVTEGVCRLTGTRGRFVRSHLLPLALTRPDTPGMPLVQYNSGSHPTRRWTSWFDDRLVIREGEDILSDLDNWAIRILRQKKLLWSGWGAAASLQEEYTPIDGTPWGIRRVEGIDPRRLRLFFLSLLWRAAATSRPEFREVELPAEHVETIGRMLRDGEPGALEFYPTTLTQLSTRGLAQNIVPLAQQKKIPNLPGLGHRTMPFFRFYLDGLVAHVNRQVTGSIDQFRPGLVGEDDSLVLSTVTYEGSFQRENLMHVLHESVPRARS